MLNKEKIRKIKPVLLKMYKKSMNISKYFVRQLIQKYGMQKVIFAFIGVIVLLLTVILFSSCSGDKKVSESISDIIPKLSVNKLRSFEEMNNLCKINEKTIKKLADNGDLNAQFMYGYCNVYAYLDLPDSDLGITYYKKAADRGHSKAQAFLGIAYLTGKAGNVDTKLAFNWFKQAAEQDDAEAQYYTAFCYDMCYDRDNVKHGGKALYWYKKSALNGYAQAQFALGCAYSNGIWIQKDLSKSCYWWGKAAAQGNLDAQFELGASYLQYYHPCGGKPSSWDELEKYPLKAIEYLYNPATAGYKNAAGHLARAYESAYSFNKDKIEYLKKAIYWRKKQIERDGSSLTEDSMLNRLLKEENQADGNQ